MSHAYYALTGDNAMHAGDARTVTVAVVDGAGAEIDIRAASEITMVVARQPGGTPFLTKTLTSSPPGIALTGGAGNDHKFDASFIEADTVNVTPGFYYYEAEVRLATGPSTVVHGPFEIAPTSIP